MSNDKQKETQNESDGLFKVIAAIGLVLGIYGKICFNGARLVNWKNRNIYLAIGAWLATAAVMVKEDFLHLRIVDKIFSIFGAEQVFYYLSGLGWKMNLGLLGVFAPTLVLFALGIKEIMLSKKYQKAFQTVGLKNSLKQEPKVKQVIKLDEDRTLLRVASPGICQSEWERKKEALSFDFKTDIDDIKLSDDRNYIELYLSEKRLPTVVPFEKYKDYIKHPYTFLVGESKDGQMITESIRRCPHLLMGGMTGMGKSTSFKLMLYSLLKNSPKSRISFKLLDLKRGVEVSDFAGFSNVEIAKDEDEAKNILEDLVFEMNKRYDYLEEHGHKKLDPVRDNKPIVVVAVDEASVIFGVKSSSSESRKESVALRSLCEDIAKLGRAAGIHLILATQRATKTSIDTATLDNLGARVCFRTKSVSGSTAILGDKSGMLIPDIPGRAIWQKGTKDITVQVPFIDEDDLSKMCEDLLTEREENQDKKSKSDQKQDSDAQDFTVVDKA